MCIKTNYNRFRSILGSSAWPFSLCKCDESVAEPINVNPSLEKRANLIPGTLLEFIAGSPQRVIADEEIVFCD